MTSDAVDSLRTFVTPTTWAHAQRENVDELLLEQAHLEKKAAAGAMTFLFRIPCESKLHRRLSSLAREELVHYERSLRLLAARGVGFARQASSGYAERLKKAVRKDTSDRLVDELLVGALIERRSHERMSLLAAALVVREPVVARFYADLCPAEDRHEDLYVDLAILANHGRCVQARYQQLADHEAEVLRRLPFSPRLHSGLPEAGA